MFKVIRRLRMALDRSGSSYAGRSRVAEAVGCSVLGHCVDESKEAGAVGCFGPESQFTELPGGRWMYVLYWMRLCERCGARVPADAPPRNGRKGPGYDIGVVGGAGRHAQKSAEIDGVTNGARARLGYRDFSR